MIDRENLGVIAIGWPRFSVPCPVEEKWRDLESRLAPEISAREVGKGYHNAGWTYIEIEIKAPSYGRAMEEAERLDAEIILAFHSMERTTE